MVFGRVFLFLLVIDHCRKGRDTRAFIGMVRYMAADSDIKTYRERLRLLVESGLLISVERDRDRLFRHILSSGKQLSHCDAATMYLVTERQTLQFALRSKDDELPAVEILLRDAQTGAPNESHVSTYVALHGSPVHIKDVYAETRFDLSGTLRFDEESGYRTVSMLTLPMSTPESEVLGVLQFINAMDPLSGCIIGFGDEVIELLGALASFAAVALKNQQLIENQKRLLDGMILAISGAIDAKSPYTGGHCARVPELAIMLAEEACRVSEGPLAPFCFSGEEEWEEFRIGAWLHDCGKVVTPVHIVDKATKLETLYNRIHEIRMRFEVLLRDAEIQRLNTGMTGGDAETAHRQFEERKAELEADFAFIAECNLGVESMAPENIARIRSIARQTWLRHFDDRLGLSEGELGRYAADSPAALPVTERLLDDQPHHIQPRDGEKEHDPRYGFKIKVPEHEHHAGEIHNLSIQRGTLTEEERFKVNEHIIQTIMMLDSLSFPPSLRRVPEYAGTHHETLAGTGYPRCLKAEQLSVPARIVAIADIFEALTASDRPYKKAKTLSEAVGILHSMKTERQIDPDLFDLFLASGVYRRYAERFLDARQIDEVDIGRYLG